LVGWFLAGASAVRATFFIVKQKAVAAASRTIVATGNRFVGILIVVVLRVVGVAHAAIANGRP
jgi:hypothetical protein